MKIVLLVTIAIVAFVSSEAAKKMMIGRVQMMLPIRKSLQQICSPKVINRFVSISSQSWAAEPLGKKGLVAAERAKLRDSLKFLLSDDVQTWEESAYLKKVSSNPVSFVMRVPRINPEIFRGPKAFQINDWSCDIVLDAQRINYALEFSKSLSAEDSVVDRWSDNPTKMGVFLSGPKDVGKSAICLVAFLTSFVRSLPVVYIPRGDEWVKCSRTEEEASIYFVEQFFAQNADVIAENPHLSKIFANQLQDSEAPFRREQYVSLCLDKGSKRCGFIVDNVQSLIRAAEDKIAPKSFFAADWTNWTGLSSQLCSIICASNYSGLDYEEFNLPSGEDSRIRFVQPLVREVVLPLLSNPHSPFYLSDDDQFNREVFAAIDGMPLSLLLLQEFLDEKSFLPRETAFEDWKQMEISSLMITCELRFLYPASNRRDAISTMYLVIGNKATFGPSCKVLYDHGLIRMNPNTLEVSTIGTLAEQAIRRVYTQEIMAAERPLSQLEGSEQGMAFERQLLARILSCSPHLRLTAYSFFSSKTSFAATTTSISLYADKFISFDGGSREAKGNQYPELRRLNEDEANICLYKHTDPRYLCEGIIIPPKSSPRDPIVVFDSSVTSPYTVERKAKIVNLIAFRKRLQEHFPKRTIYLVSIISRDITDCLPKLIPKIVIDEENSESREPKNMPKNVFILDRQSMELLGIKY